ncbi:MAG: hypothetical protein LQ352_006229 [Teloschistes flavicans]|nr:MAG: hypothetical protein LQ352_006229 [Teloschistes flavicans]
MPAADQDMESELSEDKRVIGQDPLIPPALLQSELPAVHGPFALLASPSVDI